MEHRYLSDSDDDQNSKVIFFTKAVIESDPKPTKVDKKITVPTPTSSRYSWLTNNTTTNGIHLTTIADRIDYLDTMPLQTSPYKPLVIPCDEETGSRCVPRCGCSYYFGRAMMILGLILAISVLIIVLLYLYMKEKDYFSGHRHSPSHLARELRSYAVRLPTNVTALP